VNKWFPVILLLSMNSINAFGIICTDGAAEFCLAEKAHQQHDPTLCKNQYGCLEFLARLDDRPEDCLKISTLESFCAMQIAVIRKDPDVCNILTDTAAVPQKSDCFAQTYERLAQKTNDLTYCDKAAEMAASHRGIYNIMSAADCRNNIKTVRMAPYVDYPDDLHCDCGEQIKPLLPLNVTVKDNGSSDHGLCDSTLRAIGDLISAGKLPPSDTQILNFYDPYSYDTWYSALQNLSKSDSAQRDQWANAYRQAAYVSQSPGPHGQGMEFQYDITIPGVGAHPGLHMLKFDGRCIIEQ
jgi:hypothetical protein